MDLTLEPHVRSWVGSANDSGTDFPLQNLPFGRFRRAGVDEPFRIGVAIGDQVLDLQRVAERTLLNDATFAPAVALTRSDLNAFMALGSDARRSTRLWLSTGLREGSSSAAAWQECLLPQAQIELALPCSIGDYTDFYTSIHHATAVGRLFRPDNPLLPNYKWLPIGYHGRSSSIVVSPHAYRRPVGQTKGEEDAPDFAPSQRLDYELELGALIGAGNSLGRPVAMDSAEEQLFGLVLLNDWSARDLQAWEYQPLGPFLSKNFSTTLSPWVVTMEALEPFRVPHVRPSGDPPLLPYLDGGTNREQGAIDIWLEVWLQSAHMLDHGEPPVRLSRSNYRDAYWTLAQLVAHHTVAGCNLRPGDLLGTGTQSGPAAGQEGSLLELTVGGRQPTTLTNREKRAFLQDGDTVILRAYCERPGFRRIGFGEARGTVLPACQSEK